MPLEEFMEEFPLWVLCYGIFSVRYSDGNYYLNIYDDYTSFYKDLFLKEIMACDAFFEHVEDMGWQHFKTK